MAEYLNRAAALAQTAAELSRKVSENFMDRSRELGLDTSSIQSSEVDVKPQDIKNYLDSNYERDKISALRKLIQLISKGNDTSEYFAAVVKNVASKSLEVRKLVYIYILRYAEQEPDLALLSINSFQKDLTDSSPVIRALALRVLSGIRVRLITPIVVLALRKSAADLSPYVRKSAAFALVKCQTLDPGQTESILELLRVYLDDNSHISLGGVVMAFNQICPQRYDLIHPHYRKLCRLLPEFDEWSQISTLQLLLRYARTQFLNPSERALDETNRQESPKNKTLGSMDGFYEDIASPQVGGLNPDHALLLRSVAPLLLSQNSGVVLSTATLIFYTSPDASSVGKPLARLLRSHRETQYIVLTNISVMADSKPEIFSPFLSSFYVRAGDPKMVRDLKLDIASTVVTPSTLDALLKELLSYSQAPDEDLAKAAIRAMAKCASCSPRAATRCLSVLLNLLNDKNHVVVGEAVTAIKQLIQAAPNEEAIASVLGRLVYLFHQDYDSLSPSARAAILWLVGQYSTLLAPYAPDVFRVAVRDFPVVDLDSKMQTLTLGIKLMTQSPNGKIPMIFTHLLALARYDRNFHIRDRARLIQGACSLDQGDGVFKNHMRSVFCDPKPTPLLNSLAKDRNRFSLGSASLQLNHQVRGYQPLPEWPLEQPDGSARDKGESLSQYAGLVGNDRALSSNYSPSVVKKDPQPEDLDAFYGDDSSEHQNITSSEDSESDTSQPDSEFTDSDESDGESVSSSDSTDDLDPGEKSSLIKGS